MFLIPHTAIGQTTKWSQLLDIGPDQDAAIDVVSAGSQESIVVGVSDDSGGSERAWAAHVEANGALDWEMVLDVGSSSRFDSVIRLAGTDDYVAVGSAVVSGDREMYAVEFDVDGNVDWQNTYEGEDDDAGRDLVEHDGFVWLAGWTESFDNDSPPDRDMWVVIVDPGNDGTVYEASVAGVGTVDLAFKIGTSDFEQANTLVVADAANDEIVIAGCSDNSAGAGGDDLLAVRLDDTIVQPVYTILYGGSSGDECAHESVLSGDNVVFVGEDSSFDPFSSEPNLWTIATGADGGIEWEHSYQGSHDVWEIGWDITELSDGSLLIGGWADADTSAHTDRTSWDMILLNLDETDGSRLPDWPLFYDAYPGTDYHDEGCGVAEASNGDLLFVGESAHPTGDFEGWILKLTDDGHVNSMGTTGVCAFQDPGIRSNTSDAETQDEVSISLSFTSLTVDDHSSSASTSASDDVRCSN